MTLLPIALLLAATPPPEPAPQDADIVVQAVRGRCRIVRAGSVLDGQGLKQMADGWPEGRPLRVIEPKGANRKCLTKIVLRLDEQGFKSIQFIDPPER